MTRMDSRYGNSFSCKNIWADSDGPNRCAFARVAGSKKNDESILEFVIKVGNIVFKLQSADEKSATTLE